MACWIELNLASEFFFDGPEDSFSNFFDEDRKENNGNGLKVNRLFNFNGKYNDYNNHKLLRPVYTPIDVNSPDYYDNFKKSLPYSKLVENKALPSEYLLFIPAPLKTNKEKGYYQVPFKVIKKSKNKDDDDYDFDDMEKPKEKTPIKSFDDDDDKKDTSFIEIIPSRHRPYSNEYRYMPQQVVIKNTDKNAYKGTRGRSGKGKIIKICKTYEEPDDFGEDLGSEMSSYSYLSLPANRKKNKFVSYLKYKPKAYSGQTNAKHDDKMSMETLLRRLRFRSLIGKSSKQWLKKRSKRSYDFFSMTQGIQDLELPHTSFARDNKPIRRSDSSVYTLQVIENDKGSKEIVTELPIKLSEEAADHAANGSEFLGHLTQPKSLLENTKYSLFYHKYLEPILGKNRYNAAFSDIPAGLEDNWADISTSDMSLSDMSSIKEPQKSLHSTHSDFDLFKPVFDSYLEERSIEANFDTDTEGPSIVADFAFEDADDDQSFDDGMEPSLNFGMGMD